MIQTTSRLSAPKSVTDLQIPRRAGLEPAAFIRNYMLPRQPIVLTDATRDWDALTRWTPEFLQSRYGSMPVTIDGNEYPFDQFIDLVLGSSRSKPAPYLRNRSVHDLFPDLASDIFPLPPHLKPNWLADNFFLPPLRKFMNRLTVVELFIGGVGTKFPVLHFDYAHTHAFLNQIYGEKAVTLFAPDQTPYLYCGEKNGVSTVNDVEEPDLDRFPLFAKAVPIKLTLRPGETLFVPAGWWHTVLSLTPTITVSTNTVNASNWSDFVHDITHTKRPVFRQLMATYLLGIGAIKRRVSR